MTDLFRVNDTILSWNSCVFTIAEAPYNGLKSLDFADGIEAPLVHAGRRDGRPLGTPSGKYSVGDVKLVVLRDTAMALRVALTILGLGSYGRARFPILCQASEPIPSGVGPPVHDVLIETCRIIGDHDAQDEGTGELVTEFTIRALQLTRNGMRLWDVTKSVL